MADGTAIYLYDEGSAPTLEVGLVADYIAAQTGCTATPISCSLLAAHSSPQAWPELAARIARLRVKDPYSVSTESDPGSGEIAFEQRRLANKDRGPFGVLYDGFGFQSLLRQLLPSEELRLDRVHIVLTNRSIATWDEGDRRYHLRTIVLGLPAVISTTGLVEAPAKPRGFYLARQQAGLTMRPEAADALLKKRFTGQFLDHDAPRLTDVVKGYAMQAVVYQLTGEAFCTDPECRLYNAHWQAELLRAQLNSRPEYCPRHEALLARLRLDSKPT